jgi:hypothetical protein
MRMVTRLLVASSLLALPAQNLLAQTAVDPSGHWEGSIKAPAMDLTVIIDLAKNGNGELAGTISIPAQHLQGFPLASVTLHGDSVSFQMKGSAPGPRTFTGSLVDGGNVIAGEFAGQAGTLPFSLTRKGDAKFAAAPTSGPIARELEGTWNGTLELDGHPERLVLTMANQPGGTATGTILDLDGSNVEIPIGMAQNGSALTIEIAQVTATYSGVLSAGGRELAGTFTQGSLVLPLTFRRAAAKELRR